MAVPKRLTESEDRGAVPPLVVGVSAGARKEWNRKVIRLPRGGKKEWDGSIGPVHSRKCGESIRVVLRWGKNSLAKPECPTLHKGGREGNKKKHENRLAEGLRIINGAVIDHGPRPAQ